VKPILFLCPSTALRVDFLADFAFLLDSVRLHYEFHTTRFPGAVLSVAVLPEVTPLPITAGKPMLIEEAHVYGFVISLKLCGSGCVLATYCGSQCLSFAEN
jgi:hypothetical protein